ncbi:RNA polymerase sigma factor SigB [Caldalkalibacillus salinus]|uniref:RNA polymerase sigma factor SigB n=1 Tax=Caldalkalibacillus salinus TaxID=2803787 RepID=UPI003018A240
MSHHSKQPLHNKKEIIEWIKAYQEDPKEDIKTTLVLHYENMVKSLARKFAKSQDLYEDLYQVGMIGLLAAFSRFDPSYERSFESFAVPTIVGEIKRYLRDKTWSVHVPRRIKEHGPKVKQAIEELTGQLQRSPKAEEIAKYLELSVEEVLETMEMSQNYQALSVDSTMEADQEGGTMTLLDLVGEQDDGYDKVQKALLIEKLFDVLNEREKTILYLTYFQGLSQQETGERMQISQMHVSRLQRRALQKIRASIDEEPSELMK